MKKEFKDENNNKSYKQISYVEIVNNKQKGNTENNNNETEKYETLALYGIKNSKKRKILIVAITLLIILSIIIYCLLTYVFIKPSKVFCAALDEIEKYISKENINVETGSCVIDSKISMNVDINSAAEPFISKTLANFINSTTLELKAERNAKNVEMISNISIVNNSEQISFKSIINENTLYLFSKELFDKYIFIKLDESNKLDISNIDSRKYINCILKIIKNIKKSFKEEYFRQENIDNMKKNVLVLNDKTLKEIITYSLNNLKEEPDFLSAIGNTLNMSSDIVKSQIELYIAQIDKRKILDENTTIEVSIITEGINKVNKILLEEKNGSRSINSVTLTDISNNEIKCNINVNEEILDCILKIEKNAGNDKYKFLINSNKYGNLILNIDQNIETRLNLISFPDLSQAISINDLTLTDTNNILKNVKENKIFYTICDLIYNQGKEVNKDIANNQKKEEINGNTEKENKQENKEKILENVIKNDKVSLEFKIPTGYNMDTKYSSNSYKYFDDEKNNIQVYVSLTDESEEKYFENIKKYDYENKLGENENFYSNVSLSEIKELKLEKDKVAKYQKLTYNAGTTIKYEKVFAIYKINDKLLYKVEIEAKNSNIQDSIIRSFINVTVK